MDFLHKVCSTHCFGLTVFEIVCPSNRCVLYPHPKRFTAHGFSAIIKIKIRELRNGNVTLYKKPVHISHFTKDAPLANEPRGNKHFIFTTRVHLGLYNLLMKLEAEIDTAKSKRILSELLGL